VTGPVTGQSDFLGDKSFGLLTISDPNLILWALKPAEDGVANAGIALRVWNMSDATSKLTIKLKAWDIVSSQRATHIETAIDEAPVSNGLMATTIPGNAIETYLIKAVAGSH
jgi:alpha-mannosidase